MPWSGKTTIWKKLYKELWYDFCDFDDDILEKITLETAEEVLWVLNLRNSWFIPEDIVNREVKDILELLWDDDFLRLEWFMWKNLNFKNPTVLSTSWSLPLSLDAIYHLQQNWKVIYINTDLSIILSRLKQMKTSRIVWMWKMSLEEILIHRSNFYTLTQDASFNVPHFRYDPDKSKEERELEKSMIFLKFMVFYRNKIMHTTKCSLGENVI